MSISTVPPGVLIMSAGGPGHGFGGLGCGSSGERSGSKWISTVQLQFERSMPSCRLPEGSVFQEGQYRGPEEGWTLTEARL